MLARCRAYMSRINILPEATTISESSISGADGSKPSITILSLPNELHIQIDGYLKERKDLHALCLATKTLNAAATPLLYHSFSSGKSSHKLHQLVRTLCEQAQLANHIKQISLYVPQESIAIRPSAAELISYLEAILPIVSRDSWFHRKLAASLRAGSHDGKAILLLFLANQVEKLEIFLSGGQFAYREAQQSLLFDSFGALVPTLIEWASLPASVGPSAKKPALAKVESLRVSPDYDFLTHTMYDASDVTKAIALQYPTNYLLLPRLQSMETEFSAPWPYQLSEIRQASSRVTRLHLTDSCMATSSLAVLVRACHALIELKVRWHDSILSGHPDGVINIDFSELSVALKGHSQSLKHLKLVMSALDVDTELLSSQLSSLASFTTLESLELDDCPLFGDPSVEPVGGWEPVSLGQWSSFLPLNLKHFKLHTRKNISWAQEVLCYIDHMLPTPLHSLDVSFVELYDSPRHRRELHEIADGLSSLTVTRTNDSAFGVVRTELSALGAGRMALHLIEVRLVLRHPDGVHAALKEFREHPGVETVLDETATNPVF